MTANVALPGPRRVSEWVMQPVWIWTRDRRAAGGHRAATEQTAEAQQQEE